MFVLKIILEYKYMYSITIAQYHAYSNIILILSTYQQTYSMIQISKFLFLISKLCRNVV